MMSNLFEVRPVVIVPTYNNALSLRDVLSRIDRLGLGVIVVNDGATDATAEILAEWQRADLARHMVIDHPINRGKAAALRTAFAAAKDRFTHAVTIDSDGQHDPEQIPQLIEAARRSPRALVLGCREERLENCPARSRWGRSLSNRLVYWESGVRVRDSQSGFRVYPLGLIPELNCKAARFGYETEIITRAAWARSEIVEVPVNSRYFPVTERISHFKPWRDTLSAIGMHVRFLWASTSRRAPSTWQTSGDAQDPPVPRGQKQWAVALLGAALAIRLLNMLFMAPDSDEPQHLHVVWGWAHGLVQYRDLFDNHAPLFHLLFAPLVWALGDRADLLIWARFGMLPLVALMLWATYLIGRSLFGRQVGLWAAVLAALYGRMFMTSIEFRTDNLWAAVWLLAMAVLVSGPLTPVRGFAIGLLLGTCVAISMKTVLLALSLLLAAVTVLLLPGRAQTAPLSRGLAGFWAVALGIPLIPAALALWFYHHDALGAMYQDVIQHNLISISRHHQSVNHIVGPLILLLTVLADRRWFAAASPSTVTQRQRLLFFTAGLYYFLLLSFWPLVQKQDYLPVWPLLAVFCAAGLGRACAMGSKSRLSQGVRLFSGPAGLARLATLECLLLLAHIPRDNELAHDMATWSAVLQLTGPDEYVMDQKGELIFRRRAYDHVLEFVTRNRMRNGSLLDDLPQQLVNADVLVMGPEIWRLSMADRAFVLGNYLSVGPVLVAGMFLVASDLNSCQPIAFKVEIPGDYRVLSRHGAANGWLDGMSAAGVHRLTVGPHSYVPAAGEAQPALVLSKAIDQGFTPYYADGDKTSPRIHRAHPQSIGQALASLYRWSENHISFLSAPL